MFWGKGIIGKAVIVMMAVALVVSYQALVRAEENPLILEGKQLLLRDRDIVAAHAKFEEVLASTPDDQAANLWHAITIISENSPVMNEFRDLEVLSGNVFIGMDAEYNDNYNADADVDNIILDNDALTCTGPDTWDTLNTDPSAKVHLYNGQCRFRSTGTGLNKAIWTPNILVQGYYRLFVWVPFNETYTYEAVHTITTDYETRTVKVDQRTPHHYGTGYWSDIGVYRMNAGTSNTIAVSDVAGSGVVIADASKFQYEGMYQDEEEAVFSPGGEWILQNNVGSTYNGDCRVHDADPAADATATWTLFVPVADRDYLVYAHWPRIRENDGGAKKIKFTVTPNGGAPVDVEVNQEDNGNRSFCLGVFHFTNTAGNTVTLHSATDGKVAADEIQTVLSRPFTNLTEFQTLASGTTGQAGLIEEIDKALANLAKIGTGFEDIITDEHCPDSTQDIYIDYGDAKAIEAGLYQLKSQFTLPATFKTENADMRRLIWGEGSLDIALSILDEYPNLFKPRTDIDASALSG